MPPHVAVIEGPALQLVQALLAEREKLLEARRIKGELEAILNSVQEAIEVAGARGIVYL
ncbi:hypothetical protein [Desulfovirgula thermocuniculi]|uniref:hypothetical protein n=1 Tax=Desulfovirgula thermocuniculi TaxID=348842 RepID=UPI000416CFD1|nr:hypothetical protein [Desulfovirgula thermocuniculi]